MNVSTRKPSVSVSRGDTRKMSVAKIAEYQLIVLPSDPEFKPVAAG